MAGELHKTPEVSAIYKAKTPFINYLYNHYAHATLRTDGKHVGLPEGQMGNSEVGHMNLGAGRIVYQNLAKINIAVREGFLAKEVELIKAFQYAKKPQKHTPPRISFRRWDSFSHQSSEGITRCCQQFWSG